MRAWSPAGAAARQFLQNSRPITTASATDSAVMTSPLKTDWEVLCLHLQYGCIRSSTRRVDATCHVALRRADATHWTGRCNFKGSVGAAAIPSAQLKISAPPRLSKTPRRSTARSLSMFSYIPSRMQDVEQKQLLMLKGSGHDALQPYNGTRQTARHPKWPPTLASIGATSLGVHVLGSWLVLQVAKLGIHGSPLLHINVMLFSSMKRKSASVQSPPSHTEPLPFDAFQIKVGGSGLPPFLAKENHHCIIPESQVRSLNMAKTNDAEDHHPSCENCTPSLRIGRWCQQVVQVVNERWRHHRGLSTPSIASTHLFCWRHQQCEIHAKGEIPAQPFQGVVHSARCWWFTCKLSQKVSIQLDHRWRCHSCLQFLPRLKAFLNCGWLSSHRHLPNDGPEVGTSSCITWAMLAHR